MRCSIALSAALAEDLRRDAKVQPQRGASRSAALGASYIELPVSSTDFMPLRLRSHPPEPISDNLLATMPAMIGAPSSSWTTVSREKPAATFSISHVTRVNPSALLASLNRKRYVCTSFLGGSASST